ncbi:MAG: helicase C-terminal domain-containing protein [Planctomycetota bacterium]
MTDAGNQSQTVAFIAFDTIGNDPFASPILRVAAVLARYDEDTLPLGVESKIWQTPFGDAASEIAEALDFIKPANRVVGIDLDNDSLAITQRYYGMSATRNWLRFADIARVAYPTALGHDPVLLSRHLSNATDRSVSEVGDSGAVSQTAAAAKTYPALLVTLRAIPVVVLETMAWVLKPHDTPFSDFIEDALSDAMAREFKTMFEQGRVSLTDLLKDFATDDPPDPKPFLQKAKDASSADSEPEAKQIILAPVDEIRRFFSTDGVLSSSLKGYEERPQQAEMAVAVARALNENKCLLVEAGTGVGKSLAYLVPAIRFAMANESTIIVSTHTKNLQMQLLEKDIPFLRRHLSPDVRASVIKGRTNYLCLRKLFSVIEGAQSDIPIEEALQFPAVFHWAFTTETGDQSELTGVDFGRARGLWDRMQSSGDECVGRNCRFWKKCFIFKIRREIQDAHIAITNHALVFSDLLQETVLPQHDHIIFDEAHNIEGVATDHLSARARKWDILRAVSILHRAAKKAKSTARQHTGLLAKLRDQINPFVSGGRLPLAGMTQELMARQAERIEKAEDVAERLNAVVSVFFASLTHVFSGVVRPGDKLRFDSKSMSNGALWADVLQKKKTLLSEIGHFRKPVNGLLEDLKPLAAQDRLVRELLKDIDAQLKRINATMGDAEFVLTGDDEAYVYWIEARDAASDDIELCSAPLDIAPLLNEHLFTQKASVTLASATLKTGASFQFAKTRLGLDQLPRDRLTEIDVGTPFDFNRSVNVYVPSFIPDPGEPLFTDALSDLIVGAVRAARGRTMCLFTSHQAVGEAYDRVQAPLSKDGYRVLAQGVSGPRDSILRQFIREPSTILLGTSSFWEGVDAPGDTLSLLIIAKLPFDVHTDPVTEARCELLRRQGKDPFAELTVPTAILKLRQGFGRLIRHRTDTGVVIACDKRLLTKRYGGKFLRSLPARHQVIVSLDALVEGIRTNPLLHPEFASTLALSPDSSAKNAPPLDDECPF